MSERVSSERLAIPNRRVIIVLGSMGVYGTIDARIIAALPYEATRNGAVIGYESVRVAAVTNADSHMIDWALSRDDEIDALTHAIERTTTIKDTLDLTGTEIKEVRMGSMLIVPEPDTNYAWDNRMMRDYTDSLELLATLHSLPETVTANDFIH